MQDEVLFICDPKPGVYVVTVPGLLRMDAYARLCAHVEDVVSRDGGHVLILEPGVTIRRLDQITAWPDAEHCAA